LELWAEKKKRRWQLIWILSPSTILLIIEFSFFAAQTLYCRHNSWLPPFQLCLLAIFDRCCVLVLYSIISVVLDGGFCSRITIHLALGTWR
jgi:hypothetical protein